MIAIQKHFVSLESDRLGSCPTDKGNPFSLPILLNGIINTGKMKTIEMAGGFVTLVDDEDFEYLNQFKWHTCRSCNTWYAVRELIRRNGPTSKIRMHRVIMNPPEGKYIDHINHDGLDNRRSNLRIVTTRENIMNMERGNSTGYLGVKRHYDKFGAQIRINGKRIWLGRYDTAEEAHNVYINKVNEILNNNENGRENS